MVKLLILNKMEINNKTKLIRYLILIWFSLQAVFMFFWPIFLYYDNGIKFYEMFALGCLILPSSISIIVNNNLVRKIAICFLWVYSIFLAFFWHISYSSRQPKTYGCFSAYNYHDCKYCVANSKMVVSGIIIDRHWMNKCRAYLLE